MISFSYARPTVPYLQTLAQQIKKDRVVPFLWQERYKFREPFGFTEIFQFYFLDKTLLCTRLLMPYYLS
jgi:hypothetical protein